MVSVALFFIALLYSYNTSAIEQLVVHGQKTSERLRTSSPQPGEEAFYQSLWKESNIALIGGSNRPRFLRIRGFGDRDSFEKFSPSSIGFFIDGIDLSEEIAVISNYQDQTVFIDKSGNSVSRGSKAYGGLFLVKNEQLDHLSDYISIALGNNNSQRVQSQNVWSGNSTQILTQWTLSRSEGFHYNTYLNRKTAQREELSGHLRILNDFHQWHFSQSHLLSLSENGYDHWSLKNDLTTETDRPGQDTYRVHGHSLKIETERESFSLSSETSYTGAIHDESYDEDWGNNAKWNSTPGWNQNYDYHSEFQRRRQKWHQTFLFKNSWSHWGLHGYGHKEKQKNLSYKDNLLRRSTQPQIDFLNFALFNQSTIGNWSMGSRLEEQNLSYQGVKKNNQRWGADIGWSTKTSSQSQLSAHIKQNFRAGGVNTSPLLPESRIFFSPETSQLINIDFQYQSLKWAHKMSLFYSQRRDQQVQSSVQLSPGDPNSFVLFTENAGRSESYGAEMDGLLHFHKNFSLAYNLGLLKAQYLNYTRSGTDLSGRNLPHSPEYSFHLRGLLKLSPNWLSTLAFLQRDGFFFSNNHNFRESVARIVNLSLQYEVGLWEAQLYINNLFNQQPKIRAFLFQLEPPDFSERLYTQMGMLQNYGVRLTYHFD